MRRKPDGTGSGRRSARPTLSRGDRKLAERALQYTLACRTNAEAPLPFTVGWLQAICRQIGRPIGEHRASRMIHHLQEKHLRGSGSYRGQRHGYRVRLYRVAPGSLSVRSERSVKRSPWWKHPLFGTPDGRIPHATATERKERWRSKEFLLCEDERSRAWE